MKAGDRIGGYILKRQLGRGEAGATWLANPDRPGDDVVLKILDMGEAKDWTGFELFNHEVDALKTLSHRGIPRFIESFEDGTDGNSRLVLAMELMPGIDLEAASEGRRFTEAEVTTLFAGLADILAYLGSLRPPVIHRDVNPRNVLLGPDGNVSLVDFSGYIPLEQASGRASTRSDLYGAAATALFLLTRRNPAELPLKNLKPDLSVMPSLGPGLTAVLDSWLDPDESRRTIKPEEAARILRGEVDEKGPATLPSDSKINIVSSPGRLEISIPRVGLAKPATIGMGGFSFFWLAFVAFWTFGAIAMRAPIFFVFFSLPFWTVGIVLIRTTFVSMLRQTKLVLDSSSGMVLTERILGKGRTRAWTILDLGKCSVENVVIQNKGGTEKELMIEAGTKQIRFGKSLSERELRTVADIIQAWRAKAPRS